MRRHTLSTARSAPCTRSRSRQPSAPAGDCSPSWRPSAPGARRRFSYSSNWRRRGRGGDGGRALGGGELKCLTRAAACPSVPGMALYEVLRTSFAAREFTADLLGVELL